MFGVAAAVVLVFASLLFGDVFRAFSPWRAIGRATGAVLGRRAPAPYPYPERLGRWPAAAVLFGRGWDLFGTAASKIDYSLLSQNGFWYLEVAFVIVGHVAALTLAHDRALALYGQSKLAVRSQLTMLGVMVAFTMLALWLLFEAGR